jgi:hypothetical protein
MGRGKPDLTDEMNENLIDWERYVSLSQESHADVHVALDDDAGLESLVSHLFTL